MLKAIIYLRILKALPLPWMSDWVNGWESEWGRERCAGVISLCNPGQLQIRDCSVSTSQNAITILCYCDCVYKLKFGHFFNH